MAGKLLFEFECGFVVGKGKGRNPNLSLYLIALR